MKLISVLMTVYNGERYLAEAIQSILDQTYGNFELIIIDDGSSDGSLDIVKSFTDERIKLIVNESNRGQSYSRNRGIDLAKGEYIAIMDADDVAYPNRLDTQVQFLKSNPNISICGSFVEIISEDGSHVKIRKLVTQDQEIRIDLVFNCPIVHPSVMWRKSDFDKYDLRYSKDFKYAQDMELWSRAMFHVKFANIPEPLLKMRFRNAQSITNQFASEQRKCGLAIVKATLDRLNVKFYPQLFSERGFLLNFYKMITFKRIIQSNNLHVSRDVAKSYFCNQFKGRLSRNLAKILL